MRTDARQRQRRGRPGGAALVMGLALLAVAVLIIGNKVFVIKKITVEGNRYVSAEEVAASAGLVVGSSIFSIDSAAVKTGVNANRYLHFVSMWRDFPDQVIITVEENSPWATLMWAGMLVILGDGGVVLEHTSYIDLSLHVPMITGMKAESIRVGQPVSLSVAGQWDAVQNVLAELERQGVTQEISELNVSEMDNLYLVTEDGLQVVLGRDEALEEKILLMRAALPRLRQDHADQVRGGMLVVSTGEAADFRPPVGG